MTASKAREVPRTQETGRALRVAVTSRRTSESFMRTSVRSRKAENHPPPPRGLLPGALPTVLLAFCFVVLLVFFLPALAPIWTLASAAMFPAFLLW